MISLLKAIQFVKIFQKGGRTQPWLIQVQVEGGRVPYVVKLFKSDEVDNENTVAREVFGSLLASEFDIPTPDFALIYFSNEFIDTLPEYARKILNFRDSRMKFGVVYCANNQLLSADLPSHQLKKMIHETANIFAFDTLINNKDRGRYKTNILVSTISDDYYIFDHERAFKRIPFLIDEIKANRFPEVLKQHVFFSYLSHRKNKIELFQTFYEYLRVLNPEILSDYNRRLEEYDLHHGEITKIISYLYMLKQKPDWFVKILIDSISK